MTDTAHAALRAWAEAKHWHLGHVLALRYVTTFKPGKGGGGDHVKVRVGAEEEKCAPPPQGRSPRCCTHLPRPRPQVHTYACT